MSLAQTVGNGFWQWLDQVAEASLAIYARVAAKRAVRLVENESGQFLIYTLGNRSSAPASLAGSLRLEDGQIVSQNAEEAKAVLRGGRIDLVFQAERFLFKPLELPSRATDFLDGVVRAHIDRLTPWKPEEAAFGCSEPVEAGSGRIAVTVAATPKATIVPYLQAFAQLGVHSVAISTHSPEAAPDAPAIKISERSVTETQEKHRIRRILAMILAGGCLIAAGQRRRRYDHRRQPGSPPGRGRASYCRASRRPGRSTQRVGRSDNDSQTRACAPQKRNSIQCDCS